MALIADFRVRSPYLRQARKLGHGNAGGAPEFRNIQFPLANQLADHGLGEAAGGGSLSISQEHHGRDRTNLICHTSSLPKIVCDVQDTEQAVLGRSVLRNNRRPFFATSVLLMLGYAATPPHFQSAFILSVGNFQWLKERDNLAIMPSAGLGLDVATEIVEVAVYSV
jgi:hypothetical protein